MTDFIYTADDLNLFKLSFYIAYKILNHIFNKGKKYIRYSILNAVYKKIILRRVEVIRYFTFPNLWIFNHLYFWLQKLTWNLLILIIFIILIFTKSFIILLIYNHKISFWILFKGLRGFNSWKYDWL